MHKQNVMYTRGGHFIYLKSNNIYVFGDFVRTVVLMYDNLNKKYKCRIYMMFRDGSYSADESNLDIISRRNF